MGAKTHKMTIQTHLKNVGIKIKSLRQAKNMSQDELANLSGLSRVFIGQIERGERNITLGSLQSICAALKCKMEINIQGI